MQYAPEYHESPRSPELLPNGFFPETPRTLASFLRLQSHPSRSYFAHSGGRLLSARRPEDEGEEGCQCLRSMRSPLIPSIADDTLVDRENASPVPHSGVRLLSAQPPEDEGDDDDD